MSFNTAAQLPQKINLVYSQVSFTANNCEQLCASVSYKLHCEITSEVKPHLFVKSDDNIQISNNQKSPTKICVTT